MNELLQQIPKPSLLLGDLTSHNTVWGCQKTDEKGKVYQQLSEEKRADFACIKDVLYTAFALSPVTAYKQFAARRLHPGETVDVYLAELRKLATQFGGMTERGLGCAFIAGLPEHAENLLQATTRVDDLLISEILARARAILKDSLTCTESATTAAQLPGRQEKGVTALRRCYVCKNLTTWLEIVLGSAEVPGPQRFSFVIGASDRATLHEIVRETSESSAPISPPDLI